MLTTDFAKSIRDKYPDGVSSDGVSYADMSDQDLVSKVVAKYPTYKNQIEDFDKGGLIGNPINAVKELGSDVVGAVKERVGNIGETLKQVGEEKPIAENVGDAFKQTVDATMRKPLRIVGQGAALVSDIELAAIKFIAPKFVEDLTMKGLQKISGTELAQTVTQKIDEFKTAHPEAAQDIEDVINIASLIPELKAAQETLKGGTKVVQKIGKITDDVIDAGKVSRIAVASNEIDDVVSKIIQGDPQDLIKGKKAFSTLNLTGNNIKTYSELTDLTDDGITALANKVDSTLVNQSSIVGSIKKETANIVTNVNGSMVTQNYVDDALDQLQKLYKDTNDAVSQAKILDLRKKFDGDGLSLKEFNDIAKEYGVSKNGFNLRSGTPLAGVNTQMYENTRKGIKNTLRNLIPDENIRNAVIAMDDSMSNLYTLKRLSNKMEEKVYRLYNKVEKRGLIETLSGKVAGIVDTATMHSARGFIQKLFPSNVGLKEGNAIAIQERLVSNIKKLNKLSKVKNQTSYINDLVDLIKLNQIKVK